MAGYLSADFGRILKRRSHRSGKVALEFLENYRGYIQSDNYNVAENAIRPFVLGRKNWSFSGSPKGAEASATFFTRIKTAKANGLEPYGYLFAPKNKKISKPIKGFSGMYSLKRLSEFL